MLQDALTGGGECDGGRMHMEGDPHESARINMRHNTAQDSIQTRCCSDTTEHVRGQAPAHAHPHVHAHAHAHMRPLTFHTVPYILQPCPVDVDMSLAVVCVWQWLLIGAMSVLIWQWV